MIFLFLYNISFDCIFNCSTSSQPFYHTKNNLLKDLYLLMLAKATQYQKFISHYISLCFFLLFFFYFHQEFCSFVELQKLAKENLLIKENNV